MGRTQCVYLFISKHPQYSVQCSDAHSASRRLALSSPAHITGSSPLGLIHKYGMINCSQLVEKKINRIPIIDRLLGFFTDEVSSFRRTPVFERYKIPSRETEKASVVEGRRRFRPSIVSRAPFVSAVSRAQGRGHDSHASAVRPSASLGSAVLLERPVAPLFLLVLSDNERGRG